MSEQCLAQSDRPIMVSVILFTIFISTSMVQMSGVYSIVYYLPSAEMTRELSPQSRITQCKEIL